MMFLVDIYFLLVQEAALQLVAIKCMTGKNFEATQYLYFCLAHLKLQRQRSSGPLVRENWDRGKPFWGKIGAKSGQNPAKFGAKSGKSEQIGIKTEVNYPNIPGIQPWFFVLRFFHKVVPLVFYEKFKIRSKFGANWPFAPNSEHCPDFRDD